jgi:hypothetical protein
LSKTIFKELETIGEGEFNNKKPAIDSQQRDLQKVYFTALSLYALNQLRYGPASTLDTQQIAKNQLKVVWKRIDEILSSDAKLDLSSRLHLENLKTTADKVFNSVVNTNIGL